MNRPYANTHSKDPLGRAIGISVGLHVAVFVALTVRAVFFPSEPIQLQDAIRVDLVGLPDKKQTLPDIPAPKPAAKAPSQPKPAPVEPPKPAPKPEPVAKPETPKVNLNKQKVDLEKAKREQESALKRLEALQRLERLAKSEPTSKPSSGTNEGLAAAAIKGNQISEGNALKGIAKLDHQAYIRSIDTKVRRHWNLPQWLANAGFKATVRLYIDSQGFVVKKIMTRSSGNEVFDDSVMSAIDSSSPFQPPPDNLVSLLAVSGAELSFEPSN